MTWTLESKNILSILVVMILFAGLGSSSHGDLFSANPTDQYYDSLNDPRTALTNFVAPFLLIAIIFQRGFEKALSFSLAEDDRNMLSNTRSAERKRIRKYAMLMSLTVTAMIVPSPYFQIFQSYIAILFGTISYVFFFAIITAFLWVLWSAFS
ncbi:hypothetical protein GLT81_00045 [Nanohaloarchaea archaeon]|nr:hypothetical protein [Candidatus Nanohaloarchaea archaeon]